MNKIILITCYFGKLPTSFSLFLESCSWNPKIDWLFITDDHTPFNYPSNVKVFYSTLDSIREKTKAKLGNWISLDRPYKLCDFKPTYSLLFYDEIKEYEYWGHCDIDVVWGNLQDTILPLLNNNYVRIFKYGHLSLYRNIEDVNNIFKLSYSGISYKNALGTNISCGFDEMSGTWLLAQENGLNIFHKEIVFDLKRPGFETFLQAYNVTNYEKQCFILKDKHIYRYYQASNAKIECEERAYIHFQQRKLTFNEILPHTCCQFTEQSILPINDFEDLERCFKRNKLQQMSLWAYIKQLYIIYNKTFNYKKLKVRLKIQKILSKNF